ncbi:MAG: hypothetical protein GY702_08165 [Desulfobulbaceae bacterium]|nr:hypothetical protein [Desulfobulbaceae bacterium]
MAMTISSPRFESNNTNAPFKRSAKEIKELYFASAEEEQIGNFTLWKDSSAGRVLVQELLDFEDDNRNGKLDPGEEVRANFNLLIFVSQDKRYLEQAYRDYKPDDWEFCIFLEDNSSDIFSGTYTNMAQQDIAHEGGESIVNIKASGLLEPVLHKWLDEEYSAFVKILQDQGLDIDLSKKQIKQLMETGSLEQTRFAFIKVILQMTSKVNYFAGTIYVQVGSAILDATGFIRGYTRIQEYRWNPKKNKTDDDKQDIDNSNFTPFLLPFTHELIDVLSHYPEEHLEKISEVLTAEVKKIQGEAKKSFKQLYRLKNVNVTVRKELRKFFRSYEQFVDAGFVSMADSIKQVVPLLVAHGKKVLNIINAFYCGLWNALVEAVLGLADLIGYLFKGCGLVYNGVGVIHDTTSSFDELLPEVLELMDEMYQTVSTMDYRSFFSEVFTGIVTLVSSLNFQAISTQFSISMEQIAYYTGAIIGFIIELLLGFVSGGTTSVKAVFEKFGAVGSKTFRFFTKAFDNALGAAAKGATISLEVCIDIMRLILDRLKQGASAIRSLFDDLIELLHYGFRNVEEFFELLQTNFDTFLNNLPSSPFYTKNEVAGGWKQVQAVLDEDEFADFGKSIFCSLA